MKRGLPRNYVTYASASYLPQLRALYRSMQEHCRPFRLHLLAEGATVARWAREQIAVTGEIELANLDTFLWAHPELDPERLPGPARNGTERVWCWRWTFLADVLRMTGHPQTAIDADLMFWSSPEPVFEEIGTAPVGLLPHAFPPAAAGLPGASMESHRKYGLYNGGFVYFADHVAAERMAALTLTWSKADFYYQHYGERVWGDQGWLEMVKQEFDAHVIQHPGAAPGPWCIHTQRLEDRDGELYFGGRPLVAFHYSHPDYPDYAVDQIAAESAAGATLLLDEYDRALRLP